MSTQTPPQPLPSEAYVLGNPLNEHPAAQGRAWFSVILVGAAGMAALGCAVIAIASGDTSTGVIAGLVAVALIGLVAFLAYRAYQQRGTHVVVLEKGLARVGGKQTAVIPWDDVQAVWQAVTVHYTNGIKTGTTHVYTAQTKDGQQHRFNDGVKNVETLGNTIQKEVTARLMPRYVDAYNKGGTLTFGKLTLNKAGLSNGRETIPWGEVQQVTINRGIINVRKAGKWFGWSSQTAAQTPNLFIFLNVIDQIVGVNRPKK